MTNETKHTPTPWVYTAEMYGINNMRVYGVTGGIHNQGIANCGYDARGESKANAGFIVRACNAHDELVAALEQCKNWFEQFSPTAQLITGQQAEHPMLTSIKSALAKAKAGAA